MLPKERGLFSAYFRNRGIRQVTPFFRRHAGKRYTSAVRHVGVSDNVESHAVLTPNLPAWRRSIVENAVIRPSEA